MDDCCCEGSCPEVASDVTVVNTELDVTEALTITVPAHNPGDSIDVVLQVVDEDGDDVDTNARIELWFVETNDKSAAPMLIPPTTPGVSEFTRRTDANGELIVNIEHTGATDVFYLCAEFVGIIYISTPITLGT